MMRTQKCKQESPIFIRLGGIHYCYSCAHLPFHVHKEVGHHVHNELAEQQQEAYHVLVVLERQTVVVGAEHHDRHCKDDGDEGEDEEEENCIYGGLLQAEVVRVPR